MDYKGKHVALTGANGFIGSRLYKRLSDSGAYVEVITGDVRDPETFQSINYEYDYIFHFADPSSQVLFKRQPLYAAETTIKGFINATQAARRSGAKLVYPSTGLLSQDRENEYARCKKICEDIHLGENLDALGIRIFATYGPGESHKRDFASVPFLFIRDTIDHISPIIYGNGEQTRDFIYIDDTVDGILALAERCNEPIIDLGSGESHSFNEIVERIQYETQTEINAVYIDKPIGYVQETNAKTDKLHHYFTPKISFNEGIKRTIDHEKSNRNHDN